MTKISVVTAAGRQVYLDVLKEYILNDDSIDEWILWDNCRKESDRDYINELDRMYPKIKIFRIPNADGTNLSVNRFYKFCNERDTFYIKLDDDIVWIQPGFAKTMLDSALGEREKYIWWSPIVINNAISTWLVKYHSQVHIGNNISAQASDDVGWRSSLFAEQLHRVFISYAAAGKFSSFYAGYHDICSSRFSINALCFFGSEVADLGEMFCPPNVDDEEWISAVLPSKLKRPGRVVGNCLVSHFAFYVQESHLLKTDIIEKYYELAGIQRKAAIPSIKMNLKRRIRAYLERQLKWEPSEIDIR